MLPSILKEINIKIANTQQNLIDLGEPIPQDNQQKLTLIWKEITEFYNKFKNNLQSEYYEQKNAGQQEGKEKILTSAKIHIWFNNLYRKQMNMLNASKYYTNNDIKKIIKLYSSNSLPGFISNDCFLALMNPLLVKLKDPVDKLLENIYNSLKILGIRLIKETFVKFPNVRDVLMNLYFVKLKECKQSTQTYIETLMDCEFKVIYTIDPYYIINAHNWPESLLKDQEEQQRNSEHSRKPHSNHQEEATKDPVHDMKKKREFLIQELRKRINQYYRLNVRQLNDLVPKIIINLLINKIIEIIYF